ncbi:MAG: hypothetical protein ACOZNI_25235 [Myxococcota bacterium]
MSDRAKLAVAVAALLAMGGYYAWWATSVVRGYRWCVEDPVARDGSELVFPLWTVTEVGAGRYEISKNVKDVPIAGDPAGLEVGDTVSVVGRFRASDLAVVEEVRELHVLRRWKEGLGVLGFVVLAIATPLAFRVRDGRLEERWRT